MKPSQFILVLVLLLWLDSHGFVFAQTWTKTSAPLTNWTCVASAADGSHLVATAYGFNSMSASWPGQVFASTDYGTSWLPILPADLQEWRFLQLNWKSIATSADGMKLFAAGWTLGDVIYPVPICVSGDAGATWTNTGAFRGAWLALATSGDASKLGAAAYLGFYVSKDGGANWTRTALANADCLAWSADGTTLVAAGEDLATSTNGGGDWVSAGLTNVGWSSVAASADGSRLVAAAFDSYDEMGNIFPGRIYTTIDSGTTWTATSAPAKYWQGVASSADGTRLVAIAGQYLEGGLIYTSTDSGRNWVSNSAPNVNWVSVAASADGCKLVAAESGQGYPGAGGIYTWQTTPQPILRATLSESRLLLSWIVPSMRFVLQENPDLTSTNWSIVDVAPRLNYANLNYEVALEKGLAAKWYRLALVGAGNP